MAGSIDEAFKKALQKKSRELRTHPETISLSASKESFSPDKSIQVEQTKVPIVVYKKQKTTSAKIENHLRENQSQSLSKNPDQSKSRRKKPKNTRPKGQSNHEGGRWNNKSELQALRDSKPTSHRPDFSVYDTPSTPKSSNKTFAPYTLEISPDAKLTFVYDEPSAAETDFLLTDPTLRPHRPHAQDGGVREVTLGLDFGTSCVKCVIGDKTTQPKQAYAIPFFQGTSIDIYLLPSVLYEQDETFSLEPQTIAHRDLKLGFLADPNSQDRRVLMVGFMALVIRQSLAWFLKMHQAAYASSRINWGLAVGLPAPSLKGKLSAQYAVLARAAWYVAWADKPASKAVILDALERAKNHVEDMAPQQADEDVEITTIPEIAAQIYGFVESSSFDPNARNIFLMVDAGAGTVDVSLFHVKKERANKWGFDFFTSEVGPYGVMNLHRKRVEWWQSALREKGCSIGSQLEALGLAKFPTESNVRIPDNICDYFQPSKLAFNNEKTDPDKEFRKALRGLIIKSYKGGFENATTQVKENNLKGIDAFLCGGGFRMPYYQFIKDALQKVDGCSYLQAHSKKLDIPGNLDAPGVRKTDYDRLSVAYGLSLIRAGEIKRALPIPKVEPELANWRENYIDK